MKKRDCLLSVFSARLLMLSLLLALLPSMASAQCPDNNHPHMIDLSLPSGTKWACCNVGATTPEGFGDYFAWGETQPKDNYSWETYIHCDGSWETCHDIGSDIAGTGNDAATANWGTPWQMPSQNQFEELYNNCTSEWTTQNGVSGCTFTGPNSSTVFLPAAGTSGNYWTSTFAEISPNFAYGLDFYSNGHVGWYYDSRNNGLSVRPVAAPSSDIYINETTFPDANFRNWVLSQDYGQDGILTAEEIAGVTGINVIYEGISNLKGVEFFTTLTELFCYGNQLTSLDVSQNTALMTLYCFSNQLTSLDVSKNEALTRLYCDNNQLTSLDVSKNTALMELGFSNNKLASIDVSKNTDLIITACYNNRINEAEMGNLVESLPTVSSGTFYAKLLENANEQNVITPAQVSTAKAKGWTVYARDTDYNWVEYEGDEVSELDPIDTVDFGSDIDGDTDLDGNVVGDIYYNISSGDGGYNVGEGCIVVTTPTDDSAIDGQDIFGEDFKDNYTGIVFKVPTGKGTIKVEAQTTGGMMLKVKVGNNDPIEMALQGKLKVTIPYDVPVPTYVYIYAGSLSAGARGNRAGSDGELKIYGIEVSNDASGISAAQMDNESLPRDNYYTLDGRKVDGIPARKGVYIVNGRKVVVK